MSVILLIVTVCLIPLIIFYILKMGKTKEAEKNKQEAKRHEANEKILRPERKLHEEEKKRWENEYWERQEKK